MPPDDDKVRAEIMRLVPLLTLEGRRIVERLGEQHRLHPTDVQALGLLMLADAEGIPLTAGTLGARLGQTSGATTFVMDRLQRAGLLERSRDPNDQRRIMPRLSGTGRDLAATLYPPVARLSGEVMDRFDAAELETVRRFLTATAEAMASFRLSLSDVGPI